MPGRRGSRDTGEGVVQYDLRRWFDDSSGGGGSEVDEASMIDD
jgi:hypothetical protein